VISQASETIDDRIAALVYLTVFLVGIVAWLRSNPATGTTRSFAPPDRILSDERTRSTGGSLLSEDLV
jgi:hypothetical protein